MVEIIVVGGNFSGLTSAFPLLFVCSLLSLDSIWEEGIGRYHFTTETYNHKSPRGIQKIILIRVCGFGDTERNKNWYQWVCPIFEELCKKCLFSRTTDGLHVRLG